MIIFELQCVWSDVKVQRINKKVNDIKIRVNDQKPFHSLQIIGRKEIITNKLYKSIELTCLVGD